MSPQYQVGWRWHIRLVCLLIFSVPFVAFALQHYWRIPIWTYLWTHYLWDPYIPVMLVFILFFIVFVFSFVPFGTKPKGGELSK